MASKDSVDYFRQPYGGPEGWLQYLSVARIGLLAFVTVGSAFIIGQQQGVGYLLFLYIFGFATSIWYLDTLFRNGAVGGLQTWAQVLVDFSVVAVTVAFARGPTSLFTFVFVIVVLEAGLLLGLSQGFVMATFASIFMLVQMLYPPGLARQIGGFELSYNFLVQCLAFYLTAFISGYWNQRINQMRRFQREILDNMSSGFLITDDHGFLTVLNGAARRILALGASNWGGRHVSEILRVDSGGECPIVTALRSGRDFTSYEFRAVIGEGQSRLLGLTTNRITGADGLATGLIASFTDLTEMDAMRQEMRRQDRMAVVGELAASLAHEIRNPVAVIRGAVDELGSNTSPEELREKLCAIAIRESDHLNEIVSGFLDFARQPRLKRETFDLRDMVVEVSELVRREYDFPAALTIDVDCPDEACIVSADPSQIKQVFVNLANNAVEAMEREGTLSISVTQTSGPIEVRFDDEGPGVAPDEVARIFEPFYTTKESGVGMGLAVCLRLITAHDGVIRAYSREGGGCSMIVRLPPAQVED